MERERLLWVQQNYVRPETISAANVRLVEFHTLETLRALGREVKPEDVERLSPLGHDHINYLGKYSFALDETIRAGEFLPLRQIEDEKEEEAGEG